jgi:predicted outer membrane repeat protein
LAYWYGGAIFNYLSYSEFVSSLTITDCTFTGNTAYQGGGIASVNGWNEENGGMVTISGSTFSENSASNGGAIYHWSYSGLPTGAVIVTESISPL